MDIPITYSLATERCRLRIVARSDIPHIFNATRHKGFNDGMLWEPPETEEGLIEPFERNVKAWEEHTAYTFTIETKENHEFIGRIATRVQPEAHVWDLGFWTHPKHQGFGYMTEASREMLKFCFRELGAAKVVARHAVWNKSSEKVLKKCGLTFVRFIPHGFQKNGAWIGENQLELSRETWKRFANDGDTL